MKLRWKVTKQEGTSVQVEFNSNGAARKVILEIPRGTGKDIAENAINMAVVSYYKNSMYVGMEGEVEV